MSGHNKWSQIKHRKGEQDAKKSLTFGKMLAAISIAAKDNPNTDQNPRLRTLIEKSKEYNVPNENIERALKRAHEQKDLKEIVIEAYGPEGSAILIEAITDNSNRTIQGVRNIINEAGAKVADPGSVLWAFSQSPDRTWSAKFSQPISLEAQKKLNELVLAIEEHDDVQRVITNC